MSESLLVLAALDELELPVGKFVLSDVSAAQRVEELTPLFDWRE